MNELLKTLVDQLKGAGAGSKAVAALVGVALITAIGITAVVANRPHMEMLRTGLQDHELSAVCGALGTVGIAFETSQPPGPFTVFVDEDDRYRAFAEIYKAGALDKPLPGIDQGGGMEDIFSSQTERTLKSWKKRWEEVELMLTSMDFIQAASISTALPSGSTIGRLKGEALTASVTLQTRGRTLDNEQRSSVARVVSGAFGIKRDNIVVVDERGQLLFDGAEDDERDLGGSLHDLAEHEERWELTKTDEINARLTEILGPNKALVSIDSVWDIDQSVIRSATPSRGEVLSETKSETTTPIADSNLGGPAGFTANMPDATGGATPGTTPADPPEPIVAKTKDEEKTYAPGTTTTQQVTNKYSLTKLSIALWVDETVANPDSIRDYVANALGYDETRDPAFVAQVGPINVPEPVETEEAPAEPESGVMVLVEKYMQRGVEILVALVFIILLLKSLKGAKTSSKARAAARTQATASAEAEIDPELLARVQVEELLRADPERVGEILSAWVRDETSTAGVKS